MKQLNYIYEKYFLKITGNKVLKFYDSKICYIIKGKNKQDVIKITHILFKS